MEKYYYKFIGKDMKTCYKNKVFEWKLGENKVRFVFKGKPAGRGLHVYKNLENCSSVFYPRVFKCKIGNIYGQDAETVRTNKVELVEELEPFEVKDSRWCYLYCKFVEDKRDVWLNIKDQEYAYLYCADVKDRKEVRKHIVNSKWSYYYCFAVKDRKCMYKNITDSYWAYRYCSDVKDRPEVRKYITRSEDCVDYCRFVKDRKEVWKKITSPEWAYNYFKFIKERKELMPLVEKYTDQE